MGAGFAFQQAGMSRRVWMHLAADAFAIFALCAHEFVVQLETEPETARGSEVVAEAQIVFGRVAAAAFFHIRELGRGNAGHAGDFRLGDVPNVEGFAQGFREEVHQRQQVFVSFHGHQ